MGDDNVALGFSAGKYETGSSAFYIDNQDRVNTTGDKAGAILYGVFNATPSSQTLVINAATTISNTLTASTSFTTPSTTFALLNTTATTVNAFGATTTLNIGASETLILNFGGSTTASEFRFLEPSGSGTNYTALKAVAQAANITYSLPPTVGGAGTFLKDVAGDGVLSWATPAGSGDVNKVGTPVNNQVGVWTGDGTLEGDAALTYDSTTDTLTSVTFAGALTGIASGNALPALSNLASVAINTTLVSDLYNTDALGTTAIAWSDLFLGNGAVIEFSSAASTPDVTITHSSNLLTIAGGDLALGTNSLTMTGSLAATGARVTKGWFTDLESSNMPTVGGVAMLTISSTDSLTNKTIGAGALTLAENASIALDPAGSADGKYSGITITGTGGATIAFGDLVTLDKDDSRWELVDISVAAAATGDARGVIGIAATSSTDGAAITVLLNGIIRADANFPALTIGAAVYASTTGDIIVAQPTTVDYVIRIVGYALTADEIYFNPENDWITHIT